MHCKTCINRHQTARFAFPPHNPLRTVQSPDSGPQRLNAIYWKRIAMRIVKLKSKKWHTTSFIIARIVVVIIIIITETHAFGFYVPDVSLGRWWLTDRTQVYNNNLYSHSCLISTSHNYVIFNVSNCNLRINHCWHVLFFYSGCQGCGGRVALCMGR